MKTSALRKIALFLVLCFAMLGSIVHSQTTSGRRPVGNQSSGVMESSAGLSPAEIEKVVRAFTAKETEFRHALAQYAFQRDALIQTIGIGGEVTGEYHRSSSFVFDDHDQRFEKITFFPAPTLTEVTFTQEDLEDLGGVEPFALEASKIGQYNFTYAGKEHIDELDTYVFDVEPKIIPKKESERFFQGRVWVDQQDLQIVKVRGKGVPEGKQRFPVFETWRQQIDGRYWFPVYTRADDMLNFPHGESVHIRMVVRYDDYKKFSSKVKVTDVENGEELTPQPTPSPKKP